MSIERSSSSRSNGWPLRKRPTTRAATGWEKSNVIWPGRWKNENESLMRRPGRSPGRPEYQFTALQEEATADDVAGIVRREGEASQDGRAPRPSRGGPGSRPRAAAAETNRPMMGSRAVRAQALYSVRVSNPLRREIEKGPPGGLPRPAPVCSNDGAPLPTARGYRWLQEHVITTYV